MTSTACKKFLCLCEPFDSGLGFFVLEDADGKLWLGDDIGD